MSPRRFDVVSALRELLAGGFHGTQEQICAELSARGISANQSTISRALRKLGAVKSAEGGDVTYRLSVEHTANYTGSIQDLVLSVRSNESMVVLRTVPGSASFVGEFLDHAGIEEILGSIAGDDTLFIAPSSAAAVPGIIDRIKSAVNG